MIYFSLHKELSEQWEVEISVPVETAGETPRPLPGLLHNTHSQNNNHLNNSQRKKHLKLKDKSLDIVLNEKFVYDMNINQNNGNNDENPTEENMTMDETPRKESSTSQGSKVEKCSKIGSIDGLTGLDSGGRGEERRGVNVNYNNSTGQRGNESLETVSDSTATTAAAAGQERELGRQVGKLVAQRIQQQR